MRVDREEVVRGLTPLQLMAAMFAPGDAFTMRCVVDATKYELFRDSFADRNPLHTDAAFARAKGFTGVVMHGNILGGFLSRLIGEELPTKDVIIQSETINFRLPVYLNDELKLVATVREVFESVNAVELTFNFTNAAGHRVASGSIQIGILA